MAQQNVNLQLIQSAIIAGSNLAIGPTIMKDKKHVLLNIVTSQTTFLGFRQQHIESPIPGVTGTAQVLTWDVEAPETEQATIMTRVAVPDGGTLLLGGHKIAVEVEKEVGVPILSKIPLIGAAFSNRSKVRDRKILLILVKPTILIQEERDDEALGSMETTSARIF